MTRVPRARQLTPAQAQRIDWLRRLSRLLDSAVAVPGTPWRVGLDPVLGLVPGVGDLIALVFGLAIIWQARACGVPRVVQFRMLLNAGLDTVLGSIPLVGDLFDVAW